MGTPSVVAHVPVTQDGVYRADKISHHADRIETLRRGALTVPVTVRVSISDLCNHDCSFCSFRMEDNLNNEWFGEARGSGRQNNPSRMIPTMKMEELLEDMAAMGVLAVEFTGGGEPTVHPDHPRIFEHCLAAGLERAPNHERSTCSAAARYRIVPIHLGTVFNRRGAIRNLGCGSARIAKPVCSRPRQRPAPDQASRSRRKQYSNRCRLRRLRRELVRSV